MFLGNERQRALSSTGTGENNARDICFPSQLITTGLNAFLNNCLKGSPASSNSERHWKGQRPLLMDLAVTKPSGKAICRKEEEREEPNDASKQK